MHHEPTIRYIYSLGNYFFSLREMFEISKLSYNRRGMKSPKTFILGVGVFAIFSDYFFFQDFERKYWAKKNVHIHTQQLSFDKWKRMLTFGTNGRMIATNNFILLSELWTHPKDIWVKSFIAMLTRSVYRNFGENVFNYFQYIFLEGLKTCSVCFIWGISFFTFTVRFTTETSENLGEVWVE